MGMLSITSLERWTKEYLMNRGISLLRSDNEGPPKAPLGSPMVLNWQTSVAWKVETKYSTMGQFHYGNTERYYLRDGQRDIWWFEVFCLPFSGTKGPPKGPPRVPNSSQWTNKCAMRSRDKILYYGMISLWECWTLPHLRGGQRIE